MAADDEQQKRADRQARALQTELLYLRKGAGFTPSRVAKTPTVMHVLGGAHQTYDVHRERFLSAIHSMRDPEPELLLAVYNLGDHADPSTTLQQRRQAYGARIRRGVDTVADLEPAAIDHLRSQLVTGWYPKSPLGMRVPESHNGIIQEFVSIHTIIRDKRWQETRERYKFIAAFDEADYLNISSSIPGRVIPERDFTVETTRIRDSYSHHFIPIGGPMRRGRTYDLRYRLVPDPDLGEPGIPTDESRAFHEPTRVAVIQVDFEGPLPEQVWSYERLSFFERPGEPTNANGLLLPQGRACITLHDLYGGLFSGISWTWQRTPC